jgi:hypothetical protein
VICFFGELGESPLTALIFLESGRVGSGEVGHWCAADPQTAKGRTRMARGDGG